MIYWQSPGIEIGNAGNSIQHQKSSDVNLKDKTKTQMLKEYEEKMGKPGNKRPLSRIPLWYFLHEILEVEKCRDLIKWEDETNLVFTIKKPKELAVLWGKIKNKETMTYPKLARGIRYYYGKGVIEKYNGKRFSYKFIVSRKTKAVLSKRKNLPEEVTIIEKKCNGNRKRKITTQQDTGAANLKRYREDVDDEIINTNVSEWGSDEDESLSESELKNLDQCLTEIFQDPKFGFAHPESEISYNNRGDSDMFIMRKDPIELSSIPLIGDFTNMELPYHYTNSIEKSNESTRSEQKDLFDVYKELANDSENIMASTSCFQRSINNHYKESKPHDTLYCSDGTFRKKSKSESDFYNPMFGEQSTGSSQLTNLYRSTNHLGSLPDFSTTNEISDLRHDRSKGYFTNLLLEGSSNNPMVSQDISLDALVTDNMFDL